jgi:hypothetical protein
MEIYISIDGVLRNTIQKLEYHYRDAFLDSDITDGDDFNYEIIHPVQNDKLIDSFKFHSVEELEHFLFVEYPIEIFGHAGLSYSTTFTDINNVIYDNRDHNFTIVGLNEIGRSKPATLFFLSKNGFMGNNIKFIKSEDILENWDKCDVWVTDSKEIIDLCKNDKTVIKFNTQHNEHFTSKNEITKLTQITEICLKSTEDTTTLISTQ